MKLTLALIEEGKSIAEVAAARELSIGTITGHLIDAVARGIYEAEFFVEAEKLQNIRTVAEQLGTLQSGPIKEKLGDEYTFDDIRFALVRKWEEDKKKRDAISTADHV